MSDPILISDGEDNATPPPSSKRARKNPTPTILILDNEPALQKQPPESASTPLFVAKTPVSDDVTVIKCSFGSGTGVSSHRENKFSGKPVISLESDSEDSPSPKTSTNYEPVLADFREPHRGLEFESSDEDSDEATYKNSRITEKSFAPDNNNSWMHGAGSRSSLPNNAIEVNSEEEKKEISIENMARQNQIRSSKPTSPSGKALPKKRMSTEEVKLRKEQDKLAKTALKAKEAERKKAEKELQKWEKGKLALKSIVAEIDTKLVEGSIGGRLLSSFSEKGITVRVAPNPIERSIVWTMTVPENFAELFLQGSKIAYVLLMYEAEEFCELVASGKLLDNISSIRDQYPSYTVCFLTNKLMSYINKMEREVYKGSGKHWKKPPINEVLAKLTTHYDGVHSRHCVDEAEVAEHVVGLTSSLASCQFRKKLSWLSVKADGVPSVDDPVHKQLIKKSPWLKALVAIPKVQPRYAVAVSKKYPSMKSLLKVYMDPNKSVHEKEFLLKDLKVEVLTGGETRLGEVCSKRIYRVLICESGAMKTDEVENGAASFTDPFSTQLN